MLLDFGMAHKAFKDVLRAGQLRGNQEWKRDRKHHDIRRDVEDRIGNKVVDSSGTLLCFLVSSRVCIILFSTNHYP